MNEETRVLRLGRATGDGEATNGGTRVLLPAQGWMNVRRLFNDHQRQMGAMLGKEARPGVMIFVLGGTEIEGCLWLSATDELRSASIGRHDCADLYLPMDGGLSLRHCLVLVRRVGDGVRVHVVDLSSTAGLQLEDCQGVRALDADGHFFLRLPGAVIACFPTGVSLPWNPEAMPPFESLTPRQVVSQPRAPRPIWQARQCSSESSVITLCPDPVAVEPAQLLESGEVSAGILTFASPCGRGRMPVGLSALDRGIVIGRYGRCAGTRALRHDSVSRVHALLIRRDGRLFLADAGSTNGVWLGEEEIRCGQVVAGADYHLGEHASLTWAPLD